jgi:hypothetical protein
MPPLTINRRVLSIIHDPVIPAAGQRKLHHVLGWNDPDELARRYSADVREGSYGWVNYEIVERIEVNGFTVLQDGFVYTPESFLKCWQARAGFHKPEGVDYHRLLADFDVIAKVDQDLIDEVWLFAYPWAGYYESIMAGPGAFWCNAPPLSRTEHCSRRFVVMGFNYERGVGEMLEDLGHRAESILGKVFEGKKGEANLWERFTRYDQTHPGRAEVGNVHFAPNSQRDYDWGNYRKVPSRCDNWYRFPDLNGAPRQVNCAEWGNGDIRLHHLWWFRHFPHILGETQGISQNWWEYVADPNRV